MKKGILLLCAALCLLLWSCREAPVTETTAAAVTEPSVSFASPDFPEQLKQYLSPGEMDASALAIRDGRIHYYFMSAMGMLIDETGSEPSKWGDACLIVFPDGQTMLVDSGHDSYAPILVENLKRLGVRELDYVFFSHEHIDHVGAALTEGGVFDSIPVGMVYWSAITYPGGHDLREGCQKRGISLKGLRKGAALRIGDARLEILWPEIYMTKESAKTVRAQNNMSAVFRLEYGAHSSLFPGDLYVAGEDQLLKSAGDKLNVDMVKICHHGQNTSSNLAFVQKISPKLAVAMGFMTVAPEVEAAYRSVDATVLFDRNDGYIHISSDGNDLVHEPI